MGWREVLATGAVGAAVAVNGCLSRSDRQADAVAAIRAAAAPSPGDSPNGKTAWGERYRRVADALMAIPAEERDALAVRASKGGMDLGRAADAFWGTTLADMMERGRWATVEEVLSRVPIDTVGGFAIEWYIASRFGATHLGVMCDAYARATSEVVKDSLVVRVRQAVGGAGGPIPDRRLMAVATTWFESMEGWRVNPDYPDHITLSGDFSKGLLLDPYDSPPEGP
jgi:hypothetical protein